MPKVKVLLVSHKPFKIPKGEVFVPIHAGRSVAMEKSKDGKIDAQDYQWMIEHTIGDDTGENISDKNRYFSECSALYWAWKNYDKLGNPEYIGLMHYRRYFVFNDEYFNSKLNDNWHRALSYISDEFMNEDYLRKIGLNDENILKACENYDFVVVKDTQFDLVDGNNVRDNYEKTIPGAKVKDFDKMFKVMTNLYPEYKSVVEKGIQGNKASLYQMFIMPKKIFFEYCEFLFSILFEIEKQINLDEYTINGKRTLGYLAERILTAFVWKKQDEGANILKLGVSVLDFPFEDKDIKKIISKGYPSYFEYLFLKLKSYFLNGYKLQKNKEERKIVHHKRRDYRKLKKYLKTC